MGLVASLIVNLSKGGLLPGPFIIPIYGFIFQFRRVKIAGATSAMIHMLYGVFLAPLIFAVAPAKIVYDWLLAYIGSLVPVLVVIGLIYGLGGALAAETGYRIGSKISKNLQNGAERYIRETRKS